MAEAKNTETIATSVSDFINKVNETTNHDSVVKKRLYRGLPNRQWMIMSTLELKNMRNKGAGIHSVIQEYTHNQALINHAKYHDFNKAQNESSRTHLGSLAHMRHYGAATSIIDFTGEPLVALCFACQPNQYVDGVVYSLDIYNDDRRFIEITKDEQLEEWTIDKILLATDNCFYWKPPAINKRIPVQDSYFIIGPKRFYNPPDKRINKIIIPAKHKQAILAELSKKYNISIDKFFDDLQGFAQLNSYDSTYVSIPLEHRAENYLNSSIRMIKAEAKESEILRDKASEKENKNKELFNLYNDRGNINLINGNYHKFIQKDEIANEYYKKAIDDFTEAIKIYEKAKEDHKQDKKSIFERELEIDDNYGELYYNRGSAKYGQKDYPGAIEDFKEALKIKADHIKELENKENYTKALKVKADHAKVLDSIVLAESESGNPMNAENFYKEAIAADKKFAKKYLNGSVSGSRRKKDLAKNDLSMEIEIDDEYAEASHAYGIALSKQGRYEEAIEYFNQAIRIQPQYLIALESRGLTQELLGDHQKAIDDFTKEIEINAEYALAYYDRGVAKVNIGEYKEAIKDYDRVLELEPNNPEVLNIRGDTKIRAQMYDEAVEDFTMAVKIEPRYFWAYNNRGLVRVRQGDYQRAIDDFTNAIKLNAKYAQAYYNRGMAKVNIGKYAEAIEDYDKVLELEPKNLEVLNIRGEAKIRLRMLDDAIKDFTRAIDIDDQYALAYNNRGSVWGMQGDYQRAIEDFTKAIEINDKYASAYYRRGWIKGYLAKNNDDIKEAIEDYEQAIKHNKKYPEALQKLGESRAKLGESRAKLGKHEEAIKFFDEAIESFDKAIEFNPNIKIDPNYVKAYSDRSLSKAQLKRNDQAIEDLEKIIEIIPQEPLGYYALGCLKYTLGYHKEALEFLNSAKTLIHALNLSSDYNGMLENIKEIINTIDCIPNKQKFG